MRPGLRIIAIGAALFLGFITFAFLGISWWIDSSDPPEKADILVVLGGDFSRALYAADLYTQGIAPEVWVSRVVPIPTETQLKTLGIFLPLEEEVSREILIKKRVPADVIHLYGRSVLSTSDEAISLNDELPKNKRNVLVVTSRYHVRRSRMIFRHFLRGATVHVTATPYDFFSRRWWDDKSLASDSILEILKTVYFLMGGRFVSHAEAAHQMRGIAPAAI